MTRLSTLLLALVSISVPLATGCARDRSPPSYARHPAYGWVAPPGPSPWLMPAGHQGSLQAPGAHGPEPGVPMPPGAPRLSSAAIPGGAACLRELEALGVVHRRLEALKGVDTPVELAGGVGPLRFVAGAGLPFRCDCRLAVALAWAAPYLAEMGVTEARFSGVYVNRRTRSGRPSRHALGLAIDVHAFTFAGAEPLAVQSSFQRGTDWCGSSASPLNRVACRLRQLGLFKELLTPDHDRDHHDHFHLAIAPTD